MRIEKQIAQLAQTACILEVCAPKPGNVNRNHDFDDTSLEDFLRSAIAVGSAFENAARAGVGRTIWQATVDTNRWVRSNTNLGIILLLTPLVSTCLTAREPAGGKAFLDGGLERFRERLHTTLNCLTVEDARLAYAAIRLAHPGGMGQVLQADIAEEPSITLLQAMELAKDRDAIAREYVTRYQISFETGLPILKESISRGAKFPNAVVQTFLTVLSQVPDTLISRKKGLEAAQQVSQRAHNVLADGGIFTPRGREGVAEMDRDLLDSAHALNPGTTADLTAAAIFLFLLENADLHE